MILFYMIFAALVKNKRKRKKKKILRKAKGKSVNENVLKWFNASKKKRTPSPSQMLRVKSYNDYNICT